MGTCRVFVLFVLFFFFQAEDGIRDLTVTGVQTCALPILLTADPAILARARVVSLHGLSRDAVRRYEAGGHWAYEVLAPGFKYNMSDIQIGRASCRERGEISVVAGSLKKKKKEKKGRQDVK